MVRYLTLLVLLLIIPVVHASIKEDWYYSGDSFKMGGILYSVEGTDYTNVLLGVGDNLYLLQRGECVDKGLNRYCYIKSAYSPYDASHIKFAAGNRFFGYYISIEDNTPQLTISRKLTPSTPKFGEMAEVEVTVENTGEYITNYFTYNETLPRGLEGTNPTYLAKTINPGSKFVFTYSFTPSNYSGMSLTPVVNFKYTDKLYNVTVSPLLFTVEQPYTIEKNVTTTLNLGDVGYYYINITNKDQVYPMVGTMAINIPADFYIKEKTNLTQGQNNTYYADISLAPNEWRVVGLTYGTSYSNSYKIKLNISMTINKIFLPKFTEDTINARTDKLQPTVHLSSVRTKFKPGEEITIIGYLKNINQKTAFNNVQGMLTGPGIFNDTKFSHETFYPNKNLTEVELVAVMPPVSEATTFTISLKGTYLSPSNEVLTFEDKKNIVVEPAKEYVQLTRTITPLNATAGNNITVTVHVKNVYNEYLSFTAHEQYDPDLKFVGGIKFLDVSLNRDEEKDLYTYQLLMPDHPAVNYSLTTSINVKDEDYPVKFTTPVYVIDAPAPIILQNNTGSINTTTNSKNPITKNSSQTSFNGTGTQENQTEKGFFAKIWEDIKRWFNS